MPARYFSNDRITFGRYAIVTNVENLREGDLVVYEQAAWEIAHLNTYRDDPDKRSMRLRDPRDFNRVVKGVVTGGMLVLEPHYPVCGVCSGLWPCIEHRRDREGKNMILKLEHSCACCDGQVTGKDATFTTPDGIRRRYHWAKKYGRCRQAALAEAQRCGLELVDDGWCARPRTPAD